MKILIATPLYPPEIGGPATYSRILFEGLSKFGIEVEILAFREVRHLPKIIRHFMFFLKTLLRGRKVDIIFAQDPVSVGFPAALAALLLHQKFLLKVVGDYAWEQGRQRFGVRELLDEFLEKRYGWRVEFLRKIERWVARRASRVIVPSDYLKKVVARWSIAEEKISVILNSFEAAQIGISREEARSRFNLSGTVLISSGRLVPWKGFGILIDLMPDLLREIPDARLVILGSGPEKDVLFSKVKEAGLTGSVVMTGEVLLKDVLLYMYAGDVFVLNTGYEGLSHTILEAMASGIPVVTTKVGGNQEVIKDGVNGLLVDYNDKEGILRALIRVFRDQQLREKIIFEEKNSLARFNKEAMLESIAGILKSL